MEFPRRIALAEVKELMLRELPVMFVDARTAHDWRDEELMLPRALRVDPAEVDVAVSRVPRAGATVVVYCDSPNEASSAAVARALVARGHEEVYVLDGGYRRWLASDGPMQRKSEQWLHQRVASQPNLVHDKGIPADIEHGQKRMPLPE